MAAPDPPSGRLLGQPIEPGRLGDGSPGRPRLLVDVWLAVAGDPLRVLLLRRRPDHGGFWQGVSGAVEPGDASLEAAARRELAEELGAAVVPLALVDLGRWIRFESPFSGRSFMKRSLGALLPAGTRPGWIALSEEHDEAQLLTFEEARARVRWPENREELDLLREHLGGVGPAAPPPGR